MAPGALPMVTVDRRKTRRLYGVKSGQILLENGSYVSCEVVNMSPFGACINLTKQLEIPDDLILVVEADYIQWPCRIIWRGKSQIGVAFK